MPIPKIVITAGLMVAQVAIGMAQRIKGPRLESLKTTTADYGTPIPRFWGMRRFECPIIWAEDLREEKTESKGKGGKYEEYRYYASWAVLIADHEIDAVTKIKFDDHLVYDATQTGPLSVYFGIIDGQRAPVKLARNRNMRIYLGTETQEADPRMVAWCEDRYGADSCPAYKGSAYIVFEDIPLEKFGNRIPMITVEATNNSTNAYPYEVRTKTADAAWGNQRYSAGGQRITAVSGTNIQVWDVPTRQLVISNGAFSTGVGGEIGVKPDGSFYALSGFASQSLWLIGADGNGETLVATGTTFAGGCEYAGGSVWLYTNSYGGDAVHYVVAEVITVGPVLGFIPTHFFEDEDGVAWAVGKVDGEDQVGFATCPDGTPHIVDTTGNGFACAFDNGNGEFVIWQASGHIARIDKATWTETAAVATLGGSADNLEVRSSFAATPAGAESVWVTTREHDAADLSTIRTIDSTDWVGTTFDNLFYDPINHALIGGTSADTSLTWLYLDRVANAGVTLADIVDDVSGWVGLTGQDTSALTQAIDGYSVTHGSGKDMIAPLLDIHDVDARPHDFGVQFVVRGSSPSGTLLTEDFVREGDAARYSVEIAQDTDLPRHITVDFADSAFEQQTNTVISQRPLDAMDSTREESIDLTTYVATASVAQQLSDRRFRRIWNERERQKLSLTAQELAIEPADVKTLSLDGVTRTAKLERLILQGSVLACEFVRDDPTLHNLNGALGAEIEGRDPEVIFVAAESKGFILDIPLIDDAHDNAVPQYYYGAGSYGTGDWAGAVAYETDIDGDELVQWNTILAADRTSWGYANEALGDANPNLWDRGNSVNVGMLYGTPSGATEAQIDADPTLNLALLGDELIQFTTATLESDGTYTFSGFKRGRRGTEWACADHAAGEQFVILSTLAREGYGLSDIGTQDNFKVQSIGRDPNVAPTIAVTPTGATLKPYAPARVKWTTDGTDMFGEIIRRTRVGGAWTDDGVVPLSENSEEYEVDIMDGDDVLRTIEVSGTNEFTYTAAQMSADGNAPGVPPSANVYQLSDEVGRGFALAA